MNINIADNGVTCASTVSGTLLVVITNINTGEIIKTTILAAIGAVVSFAVSMLLKHIFGKKRVVSPKTQQR